MKTETTIKIREIGNGFLVNITHGGQHDELQPFGRLTGEADTMFASDFAGAITLVGREATKLNERLLELEAEQEQRDTPR